MSKVQTNDHPGRPRERRIDDALMAAALEVFLERGFNAATIAEIARRARIGTPAIYRRWPTKADLAMDVIVNEANPQPIPDSGSLREDLVEFMRRRIRLYRTPLFHQVLLPLLMSGLVHDELQNQITMRSLAYRDQPAMRLRAAIESGQLRSDASPNRLVDLLAGTLLSPMLFGEELPAVEDAESIVDQVLTGFAGPAARNKRQAAKRPAGSPTKGRQSKPHARAAEAAKRR